MVTDSLSVSPWAPLVAHISEKRLICLIKLLGHAMRAMLSVDQSAVIDACVSLKESPLKPVLILKHATKASTEQLF